MRSDSLLIVVDLQNGFVNKNSEHVVGPIVSFVSNWLVAGGKVVATRFINEPNSAWERLIHWHRLRESPEIDLRVEFTEAFQDEEHVRVFDKTSYSSLTPQVVEILRDTATTNVFICGIATDGCVLKTAVDVFELGLKPIVISDLCASHAGEDVHEAGLLLISRFIGRDQVVSSEVVEF